jgi:phosphoenolpyruvate carboxykinase (GTP)
VQEFVEEKARLCQPESIYICDGSEEENKMLTQTLVEAGMIQRLESMQNW